MRPKVSKRNVLRFTEKLLLESKVEELPDKKPSTGEQNIAEMMSLATQLGFSIALPIVAGALGGQFLDKIFGTAPRLTLALIFLGVLTGFIYIYRIMVESQNNK